LTATSARRSSFTGSIEAETLRWCAVMILWPNVVG
jgi:hypothetical protein